MASHKAIAVPVMASRGITSVCVMGLHEATAVSVLVPHETSIAPIVTWPLRKQHTVSISVSCLEGTIEDMLASYQAAVLSWSLTMLLMSLL